jgi:L-alanine-DL-glutamate epimerase-like enolase superfamily enzyme
MKITDITTLAVGMPLKEPLGWGTNWIHTRGAVLVQVHTDEGITGLGEAGFSSGFYDRLQPVIQNVLKPLLIGQNPLDVGALWQKMFQATHTWGRRGMETYALSGVDIALWDILGKVVGQPVFRLLGAHRTQVPAYSAPSLKPASVVARESEKAASQGFQAIKLRAGLGLDEDLKIVRAARKAAGDKVVLTIDPNMAYDLPTAIQMARKFEEFNLKWVEEPILSKSLTQYLDFHSRLAATVTISVSGGESLCTRFEFQEVFPRKAFAIVQPDATGVGGISECYKVGVMASAWNVPCVPHIACSSVAGIGMAANLHVICALDNSLYIEYDAYDSAIRDQLFVEPIKAVNGIVTAPERPGLGLELDPRAVKRYRLH